MNYLLGLLSFLFFIIGCEKNEINSVPDCLREKVNTFDSTATIYSYSYKGETVYYFPPLCCDIMSELYDAECNLICRPDGGFTGGGDNQCNDFFENRTDENIIREPLSED